MIIYKCVISQDEMFSDIYKITESKDGIFYEVEGKIVTRSNDFDEALISANASTEEASEGTDDAAVSGVDIVLNHKLQETGFKKKDYLAYMKTYGKAIKEHLEKNKPERVEGFMAALPLAVKSIVSKIDDYQFFVGEGMNPDGMAALLNYREDGVTPYMLFFKDGLEAEKC